MVQEIQIGRDLTECRAKVTFSPTTTLRSLSGTDELRGRNPDVLRSEKSVLVCSAAERRILNSSGLVRLYPASGSTLQAPEADEVLLRSWILRVFCVGPTQATKEDHKGELPYSNHVR